MIYAKTVTEVDAKRRVFLRKWRLRCRPVAASLEEAGDQLFTFLRFPATNGSRSAPPTPSSGCTRSSSDASRPNASCPCDTACMLFWALLASGQITLRKVDGWKTLHIAPAEQILDLVA